MIVLRTAVDGMITILLARFMLNDVPHFLFQEDYQLERKEEEEAEKYRAKGFRVVSAFPPKGLAKSGYGDPPTPGQLRYIAILCQQLGMEKPLEERMKTKGEAGRMIRELEEEKKYRKQLKSNPSMTKVYHCTLTENLQDILSAGLRKQNTYQYFFITLEIAKEHGLTGMAILEVTLTGDDINKCEIGEILPELYEENFGTKPPPDTNLRKYLENPVPYGLAEISCTVDLIPPERIKYIETISRLKGTRGNPFTVRRTIVDQSLLDELVRVWSRIGSDTSIKMQKSTSGLTSVMGYYYGADAVVAEEGEIVGVAVYQPRFHKDIEGIHIMELHSFTHEPGVGTALTQEIITITKEKGLGFVSVSHGPGAKGFYEKMGFRLLDDPTYTELMIYPTSARLEGTCYEDAWRYLLKRNEGTLIHGSVQMASEAPRIKHAWVELPTGWLWEPQTKSYYTDRDFKIFSPIEDNRYTVEEAAILAARSGKLGPWSAEEKDKWL